MKFPPLEYRLAEDLALACELVSEEDARPIAGGQSLLPLLALRMARPAMLVDLSRLEELRGTTTENGEGPTLCIGAVTTHAEVEKDQLVAERLPILAEIASHIGHRSIRHLGTIGGSVAHADPAAEWPATCVALGAVAELRSSAGSRRVPVAELVAGPYQNNLAEGEVLTRLDFPLVRKRRFGMEEVAIRPGDFALAGVVCVLDEQDGALDGTATFFGVEGRPRSLELPQLDLERGEVPAGLAEEVVGQLEEVLEDVHASGSFRRHLAATALRRALSKALKERV